MTDRWTSRAAIAVTVTATQAIATVRNEIVHLKPLTDTPFARYEASSEDLLIE